MGLLDVWVARPGAACRVDDEDWVVRIEDAHGAVYQWAGTSYGALAAPHAHWAGNMQPGTFVVSAYRINAKKGEPNQSDSAIVEVGCDGVRCVRLFVRVRPVRDPNPPPDHEKPPRPDRRPLDRGKQRDERDRQSRKR